MKTKFNLNLDMAKSVSEICSSEELSELTESGYTFIEARLLKYCIDNDIEVFASGKKWLLVHEEDFNKKL